MIMGGDVGEDVVVSTPTKILPSTHSNIAKHLDHSAVHLVNRPRYNLGATCGQYKDGVHGWWDALNEGCDPAQASLQGIIPDGKRIQVFKQEDGGPYRWSVFDPQTGKEHKVDGAQRDLMRLAQDEIQKQPQPKPLLEAFVNSPPNYMLRNKNPGGSPLGGRWPLGDDANNLGEDMEREYAEYIVDVVVHLRKHDGINFTSIAPMNEPRGMGFASWFHMGWANVPFWWIRLQPQEGDNMNYRQQQRVTQYVREALVLKLGKEEAQRIISVASDESNFDTALDSWRLWTDSNKKLLGKVNVHDYADTILRQTMPFGIGECRAELLTSVKADAQRLGIPGLKLHQSEFSYDGTWQNWNLIGAIEGFAVEDRGMQMVG